MSKRIRLKESFLKWCLERCEGKKLPTWIESQVRSNQKKFTREIELLEKIAKLQKLLTDQELVEVQTDQINIPECDFLAVDIKTGSWYCDGKKIVPIVCKRRIWRLQKDQKECIPKGLDISRKSVIPRRTVSSGKTEINFPHGTVPFRYMRDQE